jgi:hypothetical protein
MVFSSLMGSGDEKGVDADAAAGWIKKKGRRRRRRRRRRTINLKAPQPKPESAWVRALSFVFLIA